MIAEAVVPNGSKIHLHKREQKKPPKPECIQASGLDLIAIIGKGEGMDAQQFSNLLQIGNAWGALKTTAVGFYFQRFKFNWYERYLGIWNLKSSPVDSNTQQNLRTIGIEVI